MSPDEMAARLTQIETVLAHLQHDVDSLNASLTAQFRRIQELEARFGRLEHELEIRGTDPEKRDPASERPPHY
ncbi:MAG: SlyX family protein [Planctomyces sp.]|jgi:SlyX protein